MGYHVFCIATFDYQQTYLNWSVMSDNKFD
jgi:hypothetical protein